MTYPATLDVYTTVNNGDTVSAAMFNTPNDGVEKLQIEVGIDGTAEESLKYKCDNFFVSATHVFFAQATPPTGWTTDSAHKDNVLACKSDSGTYSTVGANKGSWTYTGFTKDAHTHSLSSHTHALAVGAQLATAANKVHHVSKGGSDTLGGYTLTGGSATINALTSTTAGPSTANSGAQSDSAITHDGADRPYATVGVIATYTGA